MFRAPVNSIVEVNRTPVSTMSCPIVQPATDAPHVPVSDFFVSRERAADAKQLWVMQRIPQVVNVNPLSIDYVGYLIRRSAQWGVWMLSGDSIWHANYKTLSEAFAVERLVAPFDALRIVATEADSDGSSMCP